MELKQKQLLVEYSLKPIFDCDAKPFTLGPCIFSDPRHHNTVLGIQTCWYLKTLKFALPPMPNHVGHVAYISFFFCQFHMRSVPFFSGIWAIRVRTSWRYKVPNFQTFLFPPAFPTSSLCRFNLLPCQRGSTGSRG